MFYSRQLFIAIIRLKFCKTEYSFTNDGDVTSYNYATPAVTSYDWSRGLLIKKEDYSEGKIIKQKDGTYAIENKEGGTSIAETKGGGVETSVLVTAKPFEKKTISKTEGSYLQDKIYK